MQNINLKEVERRMRPGAFSEVGFLGWHESLVNILDQDANTLLRLGLTKEKLADALEQLLVGVIEKNLSTELRTRYRVELKTTTGFQICPFAPDPDHAQCTAAGGARFGSLDWKITDRFTGQCMQGPGLITHLIRAHGFFEGRKSPYRVDPEELARLLRLGSHWRSEQRKD